MHKDVQHQLALASHDMPLPWFPLRTSNTTVFTSLPCTPMRSLPAVSSFACTCPFHLQHLICYLPLHGPLSPTHTSFPSTGMQARTPLSPVQAAPTPTSPTGFPGFPLHHGQASHLRQLHASMSSHLHNYPIHLSLPSTPTSPPTNLPVAPAAQPAPNQPLPFAFPYFHFPSPVAPTPTAPTGGFFPSTAT